jgi:glyoxylate/hydroxypyruvate reductase A
MAIVLISASQDIAAWRESFDALLPGIELRSWPDIGEPADIEMAIVWKAPEGALQGLVNLRLICSLGQGVDHLFRFDDLPPGVPIVRLVDDAMRRQMTVYVIAAVTRRLCRMAEYESGQAAREWRPLAAYDPSATTVGVLGLGALGRDVAETLSGLGFAVRGWSRNPAFIPGVECFNAKVNFAEMLGPCHMVCCLLALTSETRGILDAAAFAAMKPGGYVINSARGGHLVEADLLAALETGQLDGATLDVFEEEPLATDSPLWDHPKVTVTPHVSAVTLVNSCAEQVAENYKRMKAGHPLLNAVDPDREY